MQDSGIVTDPDILGGSYPAFRGTRVPVETFFSHLKCGKSMDDFLIGFPTVTRKQLLAVIDYAFESVKLRQVREDHS
jgi:uncharacterized protein (DUF433 family)